MVAESEESVVLLPIKPKYADAILSGKKKVEFRKRAFKAGIRHVIIYSSSPEMKVVGWFEIENTEVGRPLTLWKKHRLSGEILYGDFSKYYEGREQAVAIVIRSVQVLSKPITLNALKRGLKAPQSFCYLHSRYLTKLVSLTDVRAK